MPLGSHRFPWVWRKIALKTTAGTFVFGNEQGVFVKKAVGAASAVTLPPPPSGPLVNISVLVVDAKGDAATNNITITPATVGGVTPTIDGAANLVIAANFGVAALVWNGTEWNALWQDNWSGKSLTIPDAGNIVLGTTTGTKIGTAASQLLGFWNATPVVQPASTGELLGLNGNAATAANATNMNSNGNLGSKAYTFNDVVKMLKTAGILATS